MKSLIVIYSKTGNTLSVAQKIKKVTDFDLEEVKAQSDDPNIAKPELIYKPNVKPYNHLVFASPVHGFSLSRIMHAYLKQLPDLTGKTVDLFITHYFPYAWLGGNHTLKQMKSLVEDKGGRVMSMTSINWKTKKRKDVIMKMIENYKAEAKI
ncbi:MAG: flavodoxin [Firmicutes bacterium]|nr:flavodoxin [Bacillota bacterium]